MIQQWHICQQILASQACKSVTRYIELYNWLVLKCITAQININFLINVIGNLIQMSQHDVYAVALLPLMQILIYIYTVGTESIQTPLNFSLFVILQPFAKII